MAWKFIQERVESGDIVEPSEIRINANEIVSELNGFLDSDNINRQDIGIGEVRRNTFTEVIGPDSAGYFGGDRIYIFSHERSGWHDTSRVFSNRDFNPAYPQMNYHLDESTVRDHKDGTPEIPETSLPKVKFISNHDGLAIVEFCGFVTWSKFNIDGFDHSYDDEEMWTNGKHPWIYCYYRKESKNYRLKSGYILCSQWRLTLNGMSIAESGPLGNEYSHHPIFLCGTAPITKGKDNVVKLEGRFFWYSPVTDDSIDASAWAPTVSDYGLDTHRRDCLLSSVNMVVTYRKR